MDTQIFFQIEKDTTTLEQASKKYSVEYAEEILSLDQDFLFMKLINLFFIPSL